MNIFDFFALFDALPVEAWLAIGFFLAGAIAGGSLCYELGRRHAQRAFEPVYDHINRVHESLGHKRFIILSPRVGVSSGKQKTGGKRV